MTDSVLQTKAARLEAILQIIRDQPVSSQKQLQRALAARGIDTGQTTLSRDLTELRATKVKTTSGIAVYSVPDEDGRHSANPDPDNARLARWCQDLLVGAAAAENLLVVRTPAGAANLLGAAIDGSHLEGALGTIAGDDTILVICDGVEDAHRVRDLLVGLAAGED